MKQLDRIKEKLKIVFNEKDYQLALKLISHRDFDNLSDLVKSEIKKEYKLCEPEKMTERYCILQDIQFFLMKFELTEINNEDE